MDKTALQQVLSHLEPLDEPDAELEQYQTPPRIAADVLHRMDLADALSGTVIDLGCGNGIFAIGAALLGADAVGIDVDAAAVETARENADRIREQFGDGTVRFVAGDVRESDMSGDVVVTNPPFGIQREDMNTVILEAAFGAAPVTYALLHQSRDSGEQTRRFLEAFAAERGFDAAVLTDYDFPLPRTFSFHETEKKHIKVDLYRFEQV